jgi:hypothetical protein
MRNHIKNLKIFLNYLIFLILLICFQALSSERYFIHKDQNCDGKDDSMNKTVDKKFISFSTLDTNMVIGMIETGSYEDPFDRLQELGYHNINLISPLSGLDTFLQHDVIFLPVCWADSLTGAADTILQNSEDYKQYVQMGGGLFIEQPNPYCQPGDSIVVTLLPEPVTFHYNYNKNDSQVIVDTLHVITNGLSDSETPFPADSIATLDTMYHVLVCGLITGIPSLFITEYGNGKVLVHTANPSPTSFHPISDTAYVRMINWVKSEIITSIQDQDSYYPEQIMLSQNYPNPFNPTTKIIYTIHNADFVILKIYNILGQEVQTLANKYQTAGNHTVNFNAENLSSGIYFYKLQVGSNHVQTKKMILMR